MTTLLLMLAALTPDPLVPGNPIVLRGHTESVVALAFSPDGKRLVTAGRDRVARVWNLSTGESKSLIAAKQPITCVAWSANGTTIATGDAAFEVRVFDATTLELKKMFLHPEGVLDLAILSDASLLAVGGQSGTGAVYDLTGEMKFEAKASTVRFSPDQKTLLVGERTEALALYDLKGKPGKRVPVKGVPFLATTKGLLVTFNGNDVDLHAWDLSLKPLTPFAVAEPKDRFENARRPLAQSAVLSADGATLVSSALDKVVRVWSVERRAVVKTFPLQQDGFLAIAPDGATLAVGDGLTVKLFKL